MLILTVAVLTSYVSAMLQGWYAAPDMRQATDELWTLVPPTVDQISAKMMSAADVACSPAPDGWGCC